MPPKLDELTDKQLCDLIENRWKSSETVWDIVNKTYATNVRHYTSNPEWLDTLPRKQPKVRTGRIFRNTEAVINALIANPPQPTLLAGRDTAAAKELAQAQEKYFDRRYVELNIKEVIRKALRNLYFGRLLVIKPFWDSKINDFNARALDPRKIRVQKNSTKEDDSEFVIEEVEDSILSMIRRFPTKKEEIMHEAGYTDERTLLINNPQATYKEAWIRDRVIFKFNNLILDNIPNPYWDWDGILITTEEENQLSYAEGDARRNILSAIKAEQPQRKVQNTQLPNPEAPAQPQAPTDPSVLQQPAQPEPSEQPTETGTVPLLENQEIPQTYNAYYFNHFDHPRKPYIFATVFNNENTPIGVTDMITQAIPLQVDADETKRNITRNARFMNGIWKIDANTMGKSDAQRLDTETGGVIWGKGVKDGATRETGSALPGFVFQNYQDDLAEIDNIMAASSAFRGEREGQETKGGRLALIDQSYLSLNELVQTVDYTNFELFNWFYQLAKVRYTEHHYAKTMGKDKALEILTIIQDDFMDGTEVSVIPGKTLPEDRQFKYEQAQTDVEKGIISPVDYFTTAGYDDPKELAKNKVLYDLNPALATGVTPEELQQYQPPKPPETKPPNISINYVDLPPDGQVQLAEQIGIHLDPRVIIAEKLTQHKAKQQEQQQKMMLNNPQPAAKPQ